MYQLTTGDMRYIDQSTMMWEMAIDTILTKMEEIPNVVKERINSLSDNYKKELGEYYLEAMSEDKRRLVDSILWEFDERWDKNHPEYYNIDLLIKECSEEDKESAKDAIEEVKSRFAIY